MTYQQYLDGALTTAIYPKESKGLYTNLGLCEEVGEVCGKLKKLMRDRSWDPTTPIPEDLRLPIALELGDCCWYIVNIMHEDNIQFTYELDVDPKVDLLDGIHQSIEDSIYSLVLSSHYIINRKYRNVKIIYLFMAFCDIRNIAKMCGYKLSDILQLNLDKLADRKKRNALHGSGDNR